MKAYYETVLASYYASSSSNTWNLPDDNSERSESLTGLHSHFLHSLPSLVQRNGSVFLQCFTYIFSVYIYSLIAICCEVIKNRSWNKELISTNVIMQRAPSHVCGIFPPLHSPQFKNSKLRPKSCWNAKRGGFPKPILSIKTSNLK